MSVVYCQGTFDLFHTGHVNLLKKCRAIAGTDGRVVVSLLTDLAIQKYKKHPPVISFADRKAVLEACTYVDCVVEGDNEGTQGSLDFFKPDFVVLGTDWVTKDIYKQYGMSREALDPMLVFVPYTPHISSTSIKERIQHEKV